MATFIVKDAADAVVGGVVTFGAPNLIVFTPTVPLNAGELYSVRATTDIKSTEGVPLAADYVFSFTTKAVVVPVVTSTIPSPDATEVNPNDPIQVQLNVPIDQSTVTV